MKKSVKSVAIISLFAISCNNRIAEPTQNYKQRSSKIEISTIDGIKPSMDNCKFAAGGLVSFDEKNADGERFQFEHGIFVIRPNGHQMLSLDADAPGRETESVKNPNQANEMLRSYLENRGAAKEQIGTFHVTTIKSGTGEKEEAITETFEGYVSHVQRQIEGIPVADSIAWVKFRQDGTTVAESIYWPAIPKSILAEVATFKKYLAESEALNKSINKYNQAGGLTIHHTPIANSSEFRALVTFDVISSEKSRPRIINLDINGQDIKLPWYEATISAGDLKERQK